MKAARLFMSTSIEVKSIADARKISCTVSLSERPVHFPVPPVLLKDSTPRYGKRPLHCGISIRRLSAAGHSRRGRPEPSIVERPQLPRKRT